MKDSLHSRLDSPAVGSGARDDCTCSAVPWLRFFARAPAAPGEKSGEGGAQPAPGGPAGGGEGSGGGKPGEAAVGAVNAKFGDSIGKSHVRKTEPPANRPGHVGGLTAGARM
jgi:hypothetical protein